MILISCIDDRGGLLFHGRRLSRDRVLCQDVLRTCAGSPLWMAPGSRSLFSSLRDGLSSSILTSEDFLAQAAPGEFCFLEDRPIRPFLDRVESMVLYHWNRRYPADLYLDLDTVQHHIGAVHCGQLLQAAPSSFSLEDVPPFSGEPYVVLQDNQPGFSQEDFTTDSFETYSSLDLLGRCGTAYANIGLDLMPTEERDSIGQVKPSGWQTVKYDIVDGKYLYNRCHLIGYQLSGENANEQNLITGTRYLNVEGMLPFENMVADYVQETGNHVLYRVTPIFQGTELVARGVQMEAESVEDQGEGICFNVYVYNDQPGITIDYATGASSLEGDALPEDSTQKEPEDTLYILNTSSGKFHLPFCSGAASMKEENRQAFSGSREELIAQGYSPCGQCKP